MIAPQAGSAGPPRVSVIVPYYRSAWSVERTIRSVLAQRFRPFELILIDDGSPDDVAGLLAGFGDALRIVRQENRGLAGARNRGIAESAGEFVAPLDADDLWHPDFLATMVAALDAAPDARFAYADSWRIDEDDRLLPDRALAAPPRVDFEGLLSLNTVRSGSGAVYRRAALQAVGGYDETLQARAAQGAEDWKLIIQLSAPAPPVHVPRKLIAYRLVAAGMSQARPDRQLRAVEAALDDLRAAYPRMSRALYRDARTMMIAWLLPAFLRKGDFRAALGHAARAYLANPLWWRNRNLRLAHAAWLRSLIRSLGRAGRDGRHLADLVEAGVRPFGFLDKSAGGFRPM